jgi:hypothetical protein
MPLFEILVSAVGPAIAKTLLKVWAGENKLVSDSGDSVIEILTKLIPDIRARNEASRQLDSIGERAAESLAFTFEAEGRLLMVEDQEVVASLVARTLDSSKIDVKLLIQKTWNRSNLHNTSLVKRLKNWRKCPTGVCNFSPESSKKRVNRSSILLEFYLTSLNVPFQSC